MFKEIVTSEKYWKSVLKLGFLFVVIWSIIEHIGVNKGINIQGFLETNINDGRWFKYVWSRLVGGMIYGLITSFVFQRRRIIESKK